MAKILFVNPNKWGRGITFIWLASHSGILKKNNHTVELFDATYYKEWSINEVQIQTHHNNYKKSNYDDFLVLNNSSIIKDLQNKIDNYKPDVIFWSGLSSHIHGEGEYVNIQNGYDLIKKVNTYNAKKITGGLQAISATEIVLKKMPKIDYLIRGESELVLLEIANRIDKKLNFENLKGLAFIKDKNFKQNERQEIIKDLDVLYPYDYDLFEDQVLYRPYNGKIVRAVDYEMSRGCIYSCNYCVETIIQKYYDFEKFSTKTGSITDFKKYRRNKSAQKIFEELKYLSEKKKIELIRCQDTNFLTNDRKVLLELAELMKKSNFKIKLYIETRPEGVNEKSIELLKNLKVDGVGMGVELADEEFREEELNRFADQRKTLEAFELLKKHGIKRTAYNIIGLPKQNEQSILNTINFNKKLNPDNIVAVYYSPYYGTKQQIMGKELGIFDDYEFDVDSALRSKSKGTLLPIDRLKYFKEKFVELVRSEF